MTKAQSNVLKEIKSFWNDNGYSPSFVELQIKLGYKSLSGVHKHCMQLVKRGYITHMPYAQRSIELTQKGTSYVA